MNNLYSRESLSALARSVGNGMDEGCELARLYIIAEDIDDELKPENNPVRGLLLCLENLYHHKYVHRGKDFTPHSRSTNMKHIVNSKVNKPIFAKQPRR